MLLLALFAAGISCAAAACRSCPSTFNYIGNVTLTRNSVITENSTASDATGCWTGNNTVLGVLTQRAAACMTVGFGCKAFTLEPHQTGFRSCLLHSVPDTIQQVVSRNTSCYGLFIKVQGQLAGWNIHRGATIPAVANGLVANVVAGGDFNIALLNNGGVVAWGSNLVGQTNVPVQAQQDVTAIATGVFHALALKDGRVLAWGYNSESNETVVPAAALSGNVTAIFAGDFASHAVLNGGQLVSWGALPSTLPRNLTKVRQVATSGTAAVVLFEDGTVRVYEEERWYSAPLNRPAVAVAAGETFYLTLLSNSTVQAWKYEPTAAQARLANQSRDNITSIAAGSYFAFGIATNRSVVAYAPDGFVPANSLYAETILSVPSEAKNGVVGLSVSQGDNGVLALLDTGDVIEWGRTPVVPSDLPGNVSQVCCGMDIGLLFCAVLLGDGSVYVWVPPAQGADVGRASATRLLTGAVMIHVASNAFTSKVLALMTNGSVLSRRGSSIFGASRDNLAVFNTRSTMQVVGLATYDQGETALLFANGSVALFDAIGTPVSAPKELGQNVTQITVGASDSTTSLIFTLFNNGTIAAFNPSSGTIATSSALTDIVAVAPGTPDSLMYTPLGANWSIVLCLRSNGNTTVWNPRAPTGQAFTEPVPSRGQTNIVAIAAGVYHLVTLTASGEVVQWTTGNSGLTNVPPYVAARSQQKQAVAAYFEYSFAVLTPARPPPPPPAIPPPPPTLFRPPPSPVQTAPLPSTSSPSTISSDQTTSSSQSIPPSTIAGIAVGSAGGVLVVATIIAWLMVRRRRARQEALSVTGKQGLESGTFVEVKLTSSTDKNNQNSGDDVPGQGQPRAAAAMQPSAAVMPQANMDVLIKEMLLEKLMVPWASITTGKALGSGGFGTVYLAWWKGEQMAVKTLNVEALSGKAREALRREALVMVELRHPRIVPVYGFVDDPHHCALIMRYYRAGTLSGSIAHPDYWSVNIGRRLRLGWQVANGMEYLHGRELLHGDLKTSNLLVDDNKDVVIADFGLSSVIGEMDTPKALTVQISPPEVLQDPSAPRTKAGDVYAFSIVLLEIMTGRQAYVGMRRDMVINCVVSGKRLLIPDDEMPAQVAALIQSCWAQDASERPSFADVVERLEGLLKEYDPTRQSGLPTTSGWQQSTTSTSTGTDSTNTLTWGPLPL